MPTTSQWKRARRAALFGPLALVTALALSCRRSAPAEPSALASAESAPLFKEVAASAGVRFQHSNGATGKFYYIEETGAGCAFLDYDNDGFLDIVLVQSGAFPRAPGDNSPANHCALYHNNGDGTFTDVTAGSGLDRDLG